MSEIVSVFNVTDSTTWSAVGIAALVPDGGATDNSDALNAMIQNLLMPGGLTGGLGGVLQFPSGGPSFFGFTKTINIGPVSGMNYPPNIILQGTAAQDRATPILQMSDSTQDFFVVDNHEDMDPVTDDNIAGIVFQDLFISFAYTDGQLGGGSGIVVKHGGARLQRVIFDEVPDAAANFKLSLYSSMIDCIVRVEKANGAVGVRVGDPLNRTQANETYIAGTIIGAYSGNTGGTAVQVYGADHLRMQNCRIEGWEFGIIIAPDATSENARKLFFGNVSVFTAGAALQIVPDATDAPHTVYVAQLYFAECEFTTGTNTLPDTSSGIIVGLADNAAVIDTIRFVDCHSCFWPGPGIQIVAGKNIELNGGHYSCNGSASPAFTGASSGVAITGPATGVKLAHVTCNNVAFNPLEPPEYPTATQSYGVYIGTATSSVYLTGCVLTGNLYYGVWLDGTSGSPSSIFIKACDLTDNTTGAVNISGTIGSAQIVDCSGYNDSQTVALTTTTPGSGVLLYATDFDYFGPAIVYVGMNVAITAIRVNGVLTDLKTGTFYLAPAQSIELSYGGVTAPPFTMMGQ